MWKFLLTRFKEDTRLIVRKSSRFLLLINKSWNSHFILPVLPCYHAYFLQSKVQKCKFYFRYIYMETRSFFVQCKHSRTSPINVNSITNPSLINSLLYHTDQIVQIIPTYNKLRHRTIVLDICGHQTSVSTVPYDNNLIFSNFRSYSSTFLYNMHLRTLFANCIMLMSVFLITQWQLLSAVGQ